MKLHIFIFKNEAAEKNPVITVNPRVNKTEVTVCNDKFNFSQKDKYKIGTTSPNRLVYSLIFSSEILVHKKNEKKFELRIINKTDRKSNMFSNKCISVKLRKTEYPVKKTNDSIFENVDFVKKTLNLFFDIKSNSSTPHKKSDFRDCEK
ncbi:hypothetical protein [Treponema peruense]|uniref:Uncharacterized protein n=1 Tax=Treponema peruense TaxID=2787628 RepID=A0A7T3RCF9_9SPIR|nr:hypothetical protein [Treponema peruense]QQA00455.1 hypothetical protein IWA51_09280 [Treponema peruense]